MSERKIQATNKTGGVVSIIGGAPYAGYNPKVTIVKGATSTVITEEFEGIIYETVIDKSVSGEINIYPQERID